MGACPIWRRVEQENPADRKLLLHMVSLAGSVPSACSLQSQMGSRQRGDTGWWGECCKEGWPSCDSVTLGQQAALPGDGDLICGGVCKQLLLTQSCQHSCLHGLLLNQIRVTFSLPCCVIFQADQRSTGARCVAAGTSVPTQPCRQRVGRSGGGRK